jgi:hypothetical protein
MITGTAWRMPRRNGTSPGARRLRGALIRTSARSVFRSASPRPGKCFIVATALAGAETEREVAGLHGGLLRVERPGPALAIHGGGARDGDVCDRGEIDVDPQRSQCRACAPALLARA